MSSAWTIALILIAALAVGLVILLVQMRNRGNDRLRPEEVARDENGERTWTLTLTRKVIIAGCFSFFVLFATGAVGIVVTNQRASEGTSETQLLGKCVFNLLAYRARVTEAHRTDDTPTTLPGTTTTTTLPPYADLKLPKDISRISLSQCQKYLGQIPPTKRQSVKAALRTIVTVPNP